LAPLLEKWSKTSNPLFQIFKVFWNGVKQKKSYKGFFI